MADALIHEPELLLLDEPTIGLDPNQIRSIRELVKTLCQKHTVILSTHQLREALELATHVALINRGRLAFAGERTQQMLDDTGWLYRNYGEN